MVNNETIEKIKTDYIKALKKEQMISKQRHSLACSLRLNHMFNKTQQTIITLENQYKNLTGNELCEIVDK